jgi:hypothetical protein
MRKTCLFTGIFAAYEFLSLLFASVFAGFFALFCSFFGGRKKNFVTQKNCESLFLLEIMHVKLCFIVNLYTFDQ